MPETVSEFVPTGSIGVILGAVISVLVAKYVLPYHCKWWREGIDLMVRKQLHETYFCGYHFDDVCALSFFPRYRKFVDHGFCGAIAGLSMLAMRKNRTSRIVELRYIDEKDGETCFHRWVEFRLNHVWLVLDPCWLPHGVTFRDRYYEWFGVYESTSSISHVCKYREFWSYRISQEMAEKLKRPETSWQFYEIDQAFCWARGYHDEHFFSPQIEQLTAYWGGERPSPGFLLNDDHDDVEIIFTSRIMHEYMARPKRLHPKRHTIRKAKKLKKIIQSAYSDFLAEEKAKEAASATSADSQDSTGPTDSAKETAPATSADPHSCSEARAS